MAVSAASQSLQCEILLQKWDMDLEIRQSPNGIGASAFYQTAGISIRKETYPDSFLFPQLSYPLPSLIFAAITILKKE
jgi:hypothetical protein